MKGLETQLSASLKLINRAIQALKDHVEAALQSFKDEVEALTARVVKLEERASHHQICNPIGACDTCDPTCSCMNEGEGVVMQQKGDLPHVSYASVVARDQL